MIEIMSTSPGLDDSELVSYHYSRAERNLVFLIEAWNAQLLHINFSDVIYFMDYGSIGTSMLQLNPLRTDLLFEVVNRRYVKIPEDHPYKLYEFLDIDDCVSFQIVSAELTLSTLDVR